MTDNISQGYVMFYIKAHYERKVKDFLVVSGILVEWVCQSVHLYKYPIGIIHFKML